MVALAAVASLGTVPGAVLGTLAGALAGAAGAGLAVEKLARGIAEQLAALKQADARALLSNPPAGPSWTRPIEALKRSLDSSGRANDDLAEVDRLTRTLWSAAHGREEGGRGLTLRQCLLGLINEFRQTAGKLVKDAGTLHEAAEKMATGAVDQSETVARTTTTVEALSDRIDRISQNADDAADACKKARHEARRGLDQVHSVIDGMDRLRAQVEANGRKARRLGDRSIEIGTIVELIKGISSRTDMLALNATIESVRAGEHGRGFAVVAEEIRKLAERAAAATREIGTIVEAIQADTHESLRALGEEQTEVEQEAQRVREAGASLQRISEVAEDSARLVDGISRSTNDQVVATQELVRAMQRISAVLTHQALRGDGPGPRIRPRDHTRLRPPAPAVGS